MQGNGMQGNNNRPPHFLRRKEWTAVGVIVALSTGLYNILLGHSVLDLVKGTKSEASSEQSSQDTQEKKAREAKKQKLREAQERKASEAQQEKLREAQGKKAHEAQEKAHVKLADAALEVGDYETAKRETNLALQVNPRSIPALLDAATACSKKCEADKEARKQPDVENVRQWHTRLITLKELSPIAKYEPGTAEYINTSINDIEAYANQEGWEL